MTSATVRGDAATSMMTPPMHHPADNLHRSPWTRRQNLVRLLWGAVACTLFRLSPKPCYAWRRFLLRCFGAGVHRTAHIRSSVRIEIPWNLAIGEHTSVGDHAILYALGPITIGRYCTISQYAHLCAGTHDYNDPDMPLLRPPITLGDHVWIAADAFVGPDVTVGDGVVLGARAVAFRDLKPWMLYGGNPARPLGQRAPQDHKVNSAT